MEGEPMITTIGLFPLGLVLFPGASYPLHIFENRYKALVNEAIDGGAEFGINLVEDGRMFQIGCLAKVASIEQRYDDGRMDIIVTGTSRYTIQGYRSGERPYLTADAEPLVDEEDPVAFELLDSTIALFNQLIESVYGEDSEEILTSTDWINGGASFRIAQKSGLELSIRQQLLEMRSEKERLEFLSNYLTDLLPNVREVERMQLLSRNDGYVHLDDFTGNESNGDDA
jgi:Lon protease-like protein